MQERQEGTLDVDELWLRELAAELVGELEAYLGRHAAFAAWLAAREPTDEPC